MTIYVVATSKKEAQEIFDAGFDVAFKTEAEAQAHLEYVKSPPTDPYYANQYRIFKLEKSDA